MAEKVRRIFVEKKPGYNVEAQRLYRDLKETLRLAGLKGVRILNRYDVAGISDEVYERARCTIFSEPTVDYVYDEEVKFAPDERVFAVEYLPGQYDQRADSAAQCIQILTQEERPLVRTAKVIVLQGEISDEEFTRVKNYCINPVDSREASLDKPFSLEMECAAPEDVPVIHGFTGMDDDQLAQLMEQMGFAMSFADLKFVQEYFRHQEKRDPTETELRVIDTYWSDHCRHTTFLTEIEEVDFAPGSLVEPVKEAYREYGRSREFVYGDKPREQCLMDIATIAMKEMRRRGMLPDLDESEEINACSIVVEVDVDGRKEEWLVMFKNETHNHPTEIEPFGGAATCLGGAIRDPLSGRSYVYQAMRVTGSGDPRTPVEKTLPGKLPQRKITTEAAHGFSSYGNQVGLATGQVAEIYDEGYVAKRMEIGAVIGAAPRRNVVRAKPQPGDVVLLVGGRTGRDGCGGATGSSKAHTEESIFTCGAEVQKGNPPEERKLQRLFRRPEVSRLIKKCNDFGAGGVSVAIGELTDGIEVDLDAIPRKYEGLNGTELAISESQERMAVVVAAEDAERFIAYAREENLEATVVARVTADRRMRMVWHGKTIVDISRDFLNTNGVRQKTKVYVAAPAEADNYFRRLEQEVAAKIDDLREAWLANLRDLNVCGQRGLVERFDSTIGAGTVLLPFGGLYQATPTEGMVAKIPLLSGETTTGTVMTFGYNPRLAKWSPFHGALYAVVEAVAKAVALGCDYRRLRLSLQEYFEKLGKDPVRWGKPFSALLGAFYAQKKLGIPAIGGKDSMSGTFKDLHVPPTLVAFAVGVVDVRHVVSPEFKEVGNPVILIPVRRDEREMPDFEGMRAAYERVHRLIQEGQVRAAQAIRIGGLAAALTKMTFGNRIGITLAGEMDPHALFVSEYGSLVLELSREVDLAQALAGVEYRLLGYTVAEPVITVNGVKIRVDEALQEWEKPLEPIFPTRTEIPAEKPMTIVYEGRNTSRPKVKIAKPRIFMPVFPGTNCEYDTAKAFERAGGIVETLVFRNLTPAEVEESIAAMVAGINRAQIIMLAGGFSAGDEPEGSGKFIATVFRNPRVKEAVMKLLKERDGLILGICNGFQALIKLGLVPYGEIIDIDENCPTLTYNTIGRHVSRMVRTKVVSTLSPWFSNVKVGDIHTIPVSHGEGRFVAPPDLIADLAAAGQIATQYVDLEGNPTYDPDFNPNGSMHAIEGITSPDGRVLGKMGHSERIGPWVAVNVPGEKDQKIFEAGVNYFS